jgi:parallel beta-helix repeat protein
LIRWNNQQDAEGGILRSQMTITGFLCFFLLIHLVSPIVIVESSSSPKGAAINASIHDPIVIISDSDFEMQGWPGNGSENNPYLIEDLEIESSQRMGELDMEACIQISFTSVHFIIRNCTLSYEIINQWDQPPTGIILFIVSNARIENCTFMNLDRGIYSLYCNTSSYLSSTFMYCRVGFYLHCVENAMIDWNSLRFNKFGMFLYYSTDCNITENFIAYNTEKGVFLDGGSNRNHIFNNTIGYNQADLAHAEYNAQDDGHDNLWDDNNTIGNAWSDYSGEGVYNISGYANSVDRFPRLVHFDLAGPEIYWVTDWRITVYPGPCPFSDLTIHASARDQTGVDSVFIFYSSSLNGTWTCIEMTYTPTEQYPDRYTFYIDGPFYSFDFIRYYFVWANDTVGLGSASEMLGNWNHCSGGPITCPLCPIIFGTMITACGAIVVLFIVCRKKRK